MLDDISNTQRIKQSIAELYEKADNSRNSEMRMWRLRHHHMTHYVKSLRLNNIDAIRGNAKSTTIDCTNSEN